MPAGSPAPGPAPVAGPRRLHPASPFLDLSGLGRQLLAPGVVALGTGGMGLLLLGTVVVVGVKVLAWRRRTYLLADGVLKVEGGLLVRSQQLVPCERIQQVNLVQKLRHRALGVAVLDVETAGGDSGVRLEALEATQAEQLREELLAAKARARNAARGEQAEGEAPAAAWVPTPWRVVELTHRQLAVAGVTGVELLVVFALGATASQFVGEGGPLGGVDVPAFDVLGPVVVAGAALVFVVVWLATAVAASILADSGYRLTLVGDELHVVRGLLDRKEASLPLARVQAVRIAASAPRRLLGLVSLRIDSAGSGSGDEDRRVRVPVLPVTELERVLGLVLPGFDAVPPLLRPPPAARRRALVRHTVPTAVLVLGVTAVAWPWGALAVGLVPLAAVAGAAAYRGLGHAVSETFLFARSGWFNRRTVVVPLARVQSARLHATPWQRRSDLATLSVDLAGPGPVPAVIDESTRVGRALLRAATGRGPSRGGT